MIKVLYWNCRGIANNPTKRALANMVHNHSPDLILISEPMISLSSTQSLNLHNYGFDTFHSNAPHLVCADLWCISKSSSQFSTTLSDSSSQHISMLLTNQISGLSTQIIGVYGANKPTLRKDLWKVLIDSSSTTLPWCVMGDFNAILTHEEKQSLRQSTPSSLKDFQLAVLQAGLKDIQYSGSRFTWSNNRQRLSYVAARLDRVLVNSHSIDT